MLLERYSLGILNKNKEQTLKALFKIKKTNDSLKILREKIMKNFTLMILMALTFVTLDPTVYAQAETQKQAAAYQQAQADTGEGEQEACNSGENCSGDGI